MSVWFFVAISLMGLFIVLLSLSASKVKPAQWFGFCLLVLVVTSASFLLLRLTPPQPIQVEMSRMMAARDGASICFDYAIQLTEPVSATQLAAKATTLYYIHQQSMTQEVSLLLEQALQIEPHNEAALSLIANDHFLSFRFQEAIDTWVLLLDSNDPNLDRVQIIHSINKAKELL